MLPLFRKFQTILEQANTLFEHYKTNITANHAVYWHENGWLNKTIRSAQAMTSEQTGRINRN
jgi:hypothetical protein